MPQWVVAAVSESEAIAAMELAVAMAEAVTAAAVAKAALAELNHRNSSQKGV